MARVQVLTSLDDARIEPLLRQDDFFWLDLLDPSPDELSTLAERFRLHPLAVEDTREFGQRPKMDDYGETALIVFYGVQPDGTPAEVHLHLSGTWMVTVHRNARPLLANAAKRVQREPPRTEEEALYRVLDHLTDSFFPVLDAIDDEIDELTDAIVERPALEQRQKLFDLRRRLIELRRIASPQRDMLARGNDLIADIPGLEGDAARDWFRDVYDHLLRISEAIDSYRDLLSGALDVYLSTVSNRLSQISKQLTVVATIFLPLTFVTGFFGQNFGTLVRHINTPAAFWGYGIGSMVVSGLLLLLWFKRSGFLEP